jgi:surface polysaccharide O-acyltransferase-like enzyme
MPADMTGRDRGIDSFRLFMAIAVVVLHSIPQNLVGRTPVPLPAWAPFVDLLCRTAVPFFFIVSGYYARAELSPSRTTLRPLQRISPVYLAWLAVYLLFAPLLGEQYSRLSWTSLYDGGPAHHLWFLPALALSLIVVPLARNWLGVRVTGWIVLGLAVIGPIFFAYHRLLGVEHYPWRLSLVVRQLAAPAFVFIGMELRGRPCPTPWAALLFAVCSYIALFAESILLSRTLSAFTSYDVLFGTFLLGPATFLLARALSPWPWPDPLVRLGRLSLGIYASHLAFIWCARQFPPGGSGDTVSAVVALALLGSILVSLALSRVPLLRRLVS